MSRQWVSFNYGSARPCARTLRKSEMLPIPNNPKQDAMKLWLSIAVKPENVKIFDGQNFRVLHQRECRAINFDPSSIKLMLYARDNR